jgi:hypothetical protein
MRPLIEALEPLVKFVVGVAGAFALLCLLFGVVDVSLSAIAFALLVPMFAANAERPRELTDAELQAWLRSGWPTRRQVWPDDAS